MTAKQLVLELCRREGLKKQIDVAQITEIVGHLADLVHADSAVCEEPTYTCLIRLGAKRAKKKK